MTTTAWKRLAWGLGIGLLGGAIIVLWTISRGGVTELEGLWTQAQPVGEGRRYVLQIHGGRVVWQSTRYKNGEPLIGHTIVYDLTIDTTKEPKEITLVPRDSGLPKRFGIYELNGNTLRIAIGQDEVRPKNMAEDGCTTITLHKSE